jgi:hypothetical protein
MDVRRTHPRGGLLFGDFLLAKQEKVTRAHGKRAEKDRDVGVPPGNQKWFPPSPG